MKLDDIVVGGKYRCDQKDAQYVATVIEKSDDTVCVELGDPLGQNSGPGARGDRLGELSKVWVSPERLHSL